VIILSNTGKVKKENLFYTIGKGFLISLLISILFILVYAIVLVNTSVQESTMKPVIIIITAISILIGSSISSLKIKKSGIINGICVGGLYFLCLYILSSIIFSGFYFNLTSIIMIVIGMLFGGIGGIIGVNINK
jgi:putative membrane protein (TIGR04086 family)